MQQPYDDDEVGIDLAFLLNTMKRRMGIILSGTMLAIVLAAAYVFLVPERFTSTSKVLFDPSNLAGQSNGVVNIPRARIESEVEIARSAQNFIQVILDLDLLANEEFLPKRNPIVEMYNVIFDVPTTETDAKVAMNAARRKLSDAVTIRQVGLSSVIDFSVETEDPELSAQIANALANNYIDVQVASKVQSSNKTLRVIQEAITLARENLEESQIELVGYLEANAELISEQTGNLQIGTIASDIKQNQDNLNALQSRQAQLSQLIANSDFDALGAEVLGGLSNSVTDQLQAEAYQQLEARRKSLIRLRETPEAPEDIEATLAQIESDLSSLANERIELIVAQATDQRRELLSLNSQLETEIFSIDLPPSIAAELFSLQSTAQSARGQYSSLLDQAELLAIQAQTQVADSRMIAEAIDSSSPSFPNRNLILALGAILGFSITVAIVIIFELYFGGFTSAGQLRDYTGLNQAVEVPKHPKDFDVMDIIIHQPFTKIVEQLRSVRTLLELSIVDDEPSEKRGKVFAAMSTMPAEGKSTTALGLGLIAAGKGIKVCLIDLDFRRPQLATRTGLKTQQSLLNFLRDGKTLPRPQNVKMRGLAGKLDVLTTDFDESASADQLFFNDHFNRLIDELRGKYDYVILDTAPVLSVAASRLVMKVADNVAFCVRANETNKRLLQETLSSLGVSRESKVQPILVLSQTNVSNGAAYYDQYASYTPNNE